MINKDLIEKVLKEYKLSIYGIHGVAHWARVLENGRMLYNEYKNEANIHIIELFAILHDSKRQNDLRDKDHGKRSADFAATLQENLFHLSDDDFKLLYEACYFHSMNKHTDNKTIQICWDSDRLDLARVLIKPDAKYLFTKKAKETDTISWANKRSTMNVKPELIVNEWNIQLKNRAQIRQTIRRFLAQIFIR